MSSIKKFFSIRMLSTNAKVFHILAYFTPHIVGDWHVHEIEIDIVELQLSQRFLQCAFDLVATIVGAPQLKAE